MSKKSLVDMQNRLNAIDSEREALALEVLDVLQENDPDVANEALNTFESRRSAADWLTGPIPSLGGKTPISLLIEGERERVLNTLRAIEHGVYT